MSPPRRSPEVAPRLALVIFFASGFAALVYQVVWQRLLVIFSGADVYSATIVVAAFMAGLGFGSLGGGALADRLSRAGNIKAFAAAELAVATFGLASKWLYYDLLYARLSPLITSPLATGAVLFVGLLWPTFFMGVSLPLLARALTTTLRATGAVVGSLYGWNTLGAALGAFASTWILLPRVGLTGALIVGALLNVACAAMSIVLLASRERDEPPPVASILIEARKRSDRLPFAAWAAIYALTGFVALALEIVWFRALGVMLKSTAFTFGTLLAVYLAGLGLGAAAGARRVGYASSPGAVFLGAQFAAILYAGLSIAVLTALLAVPWPPWLFAYFAQHEGIDVYRAVAVVRDGLQGGLDPAVLPLFLEFVLLYIGLPAILVTPPTFLLGYAFPYLQQASHHDLAGLGRRIGILMAANITGSMLGAIVTGWLLLDELGTALTLRVLVGLGAVVAILYAAAVGRPRRRIAIAVAGIGLIAGVMAAMPDREALWGRLHGTSADRVLVAEDGSGVSLLKADTPDFTGQVTVFVNGSSQSWIPYGNIHTVLGALPIVLHHEPRHVLVIGLGSGDTAFAAAGTPSVERVVCVEIIGAQVETLRALTDRWPYAGLLSVLSDPRIVHVEGDGRAYLRRAGRMFDVIEADALRPTSAYSGNLYSVEYFDLVRRHLAPRGLAVTWAPTDRVRETFLSVFPYVLGFSDIFIGSNDPIPFDRSAIESRLTDPRVREYFEPAGIDVEALLRPYVDADPLSAGPGDDRPPSGELNTDLFPRDEFQLPF